MPNLQANKFANTEQSKKKQHFNRDGRQSIVSPSIKRGPCTQKIFFKT